MDDVHEMKEYSADSRLPDKEISLEDVLSDFKLSGRYHLQFLLLISYLLIINSWSSLNYIFSAESIDYR